MGKERLSMGRLVEHLLLSASFFFVLGALGTWNMPFWQEAFAVVAVAVGWLTVMGVGLLVLQRVRHGVWRRERVTRRGRDEG
ncbi:hypothetical protein GEV27_03240 [Aeromicrobium sp. S22]|uniref:hypothetical protein n=1 Tax=Aeromicrobium sp. S22 TaxID=2662029 RepID=UPI00129D74D9|nr:hypothetical protein [Aeromicrobium sp. S22]MRK00530.1 hypothetical protein [Aeromicrobium sp. S22]